MERAEGCEVVSPIDQSRGGKESEASADESLLFYCESPLYPHKTQISILIFTHLPTGKSKEAEVKRINKELANIRSKFKGDKTLDGYQKRNMSVSCYSYFSSAMTSTSGTWRRSICCPPTNTQKSRL